MHIVCCLKQVPDTAQVKIYPETNTLVRAGIESILNPFDLVAIEQAVRIKENHGGTITVITMGSPQASSILRQAISLGIDDVVLLSDRAFAGADTLATSYTLAMAIIQLENKIPVDLVLWGKQAIDGDTAQTGPEIATRLKYTQLTYVSRIQWIDPENRKIQVDGGYSVSYRDKAFESQRRYNVFMVGSAKFDRWFSDQASQKGALVVCGTVVTDLLRDETGCVTGVRTDRPDGDLNAKVVLLADGINSPLAAPLIKGGKPMEYMAHWFAEDGFDNIPKLYGDGYLIAGDSGMLFNTLHHEGSNMAMVSGAFAAQTIIEAIRKNLRKNHSLSALLRLMWDG